MKKWFFAFTLAFSVQTVQAENGTLLAGASRSKITPVVETFSDNNRNGLYDSDEPFRDVNGNGQWDPVWLAGYRGDRFAKGVHDDLYVSALALSFNETTVILISLDLIGYLFDQVDLIKNEIRQKTGVPKENILIAATHTHSGPDTIGLWGPGGKSGKNQEYLDSVNKKTVDTALAALQNRKTANLTLGKVLFDSIIEDSRPPKVKNPLLLIFCLTDEKNNVIATLVNFAMHPEVLGEANRFVTADFPGALRGDLEKRVGGTVLFFAGDLGGMQSPSVLLHNFWSCNRVGKALSVRVYRSLLNRKPEPVDSIKVQSRMLSFPVENPKFQKAIESGLFGQAGQSLEKEGNQLFLPSEISVVTVGPARFVSLPGELFPELGNMIRSKLGSDYPFLIGLCNNEIGYILPEEQWHDPGYEESMSLGPKTGTLLVNTIFELLGNP